MESTDEVDPHSYSAGTGAGLVALSRGTCYYPGCSEPLVKRIGAHVVINYDIAHLRDANPGNRYVPEMSNEERRRFGNLVLLCNPHHKLIDKIDPDPYTIAVLNRPGMSGDSEPLRVGVMSRTARYPVELRERAVRMVAQIRGEHESEGA